jgi:hypothetical protein
MSVIALTCNLFLMINTRYSMYYFSNVYARYKWDYILKSVCIHLIKKLNCI